MNIIPNTCHPSLNQWWKNGLRTVCLNWPFKFNSERLVNDNNASENLQEERSYHVHLTVFQKKGVSIGFF